MAKPHPLHTGLRLQLSDKVYSIRIMKTIITAVMLLAVNLLAFSQQNSQPKHGEEIQAGYFREYIKLRDKQVSPMMYVTHLNGLRISYGRITHKNQWLANISAGAGNW